MLGEGASGRVMLGEHLATGTQVAIKYLSDQLLADEEFLVRFRDEAHLLGELRNAHLVLFHEYIEGPRGAAIVMELVDGVSLAQLLSSEGATQPEAALAVLKGSLLGLAALHAVGVVHRDYKPGNVLVSADGESKLADFGIAVRAGENVPSAGTPAYMPPEQWGGRPVSPATDVYAATAVFYECLTGERPYPERTLPQLALAHRTAAIPVDRVPLPLQSLIRHGLGKDVYDRPQSAEAFLNELEAEAFAAYGSDWEERGRSQLKERAALLALLFPFGRPAEAGATAIGLSVLAEVAGRKKAGKVGLVAAAAAIALVVLGGGATIVVAASSSNSALPKTKVPATVSPSGDPSSDPSQTPTDSASPTVTPTDSTNPPSNPSTTSPPTNGTTTTTAPAATPTTPTPKTTKPKPKPTPTKSKPIPFSASGMAVSMDGKGGYTVNVQTKGSPAQPVKLTISFSPDNGAQTNPLSVEVTSPSYSYSSTYRFGSSCKPWTISVTASPGGATGGASQPATPCRILGIPGILG
ncbi:MAG: hypothetical protein JWN52_2979 [Actinomycetia bacterium]|nr:hypothetical protein [Actinomycetes bacterium]